MIMHLMVAQKSILRRDTVNPELRAPIMFDHRLNIGLYFAVITSGNLLGAITE